MYQKKSDTVVHFKKYVSKKAIQFSIFSKKREHVFSLYICLSINNEIK